MVRLLMFCRNDSPANLVEKRGVFWDMLRNTGEYDELVQLVQGQS
jgi:hypothetical protein